MKLTSARLFLHRLLTDSWMTKWQFASILRKLVI